MTTITHILCPVDFSEFSQRALAHAAALAKWYGAELTALHVVSALKPDPVRTLATGASVGRTLVPQTRAHILEDLQHAIDIAGASGIQVHLAAEEGETPRRILEHATATGADLIVIGTHGRSGIDGLLLGSMAAKVVWFASCPVLTVPRLAPARTSGQVVFKRILCAIDFSPSSLRALDYALSLGQEAEGKVTLLHVIESFAEEEGPRVHARFDVPEYRAHLEGDARERLRALVPEGARIWCDVDEVVSGSKAYQGILRVATAMKADLVVMGAQGRGGFDLMLFGSSTEHVLRQAACPVLTVRAGSDKSGA